MRESLARLLERKDRRLKEVADGAKALEVLRTERFDLIVAGHGRNGTDAMKLLRRFQAVRPDTKVILTGSFDSVCVHFSLSSQTPNSPCGAFTNVLLLPGVLSFSVPAFWLPLPGAALLPVPKLPPTLGGLPVPERLPIPGVLPGTELLP